MAKKYIRKSTVQAIANALKSRKPSLQTVQGSAIANQVQSLEIVQSISPGSQSLNKDRTSYTIGRGRNTSGSVSVTPESLTATLQASDKTYSAASGKALYQVTVPATDRNTVTSRLVEPSGGSVEITGLSFTPKGIVIAKTSRASASDGYLLGGLLCVGQTVYGGMSWKGTGQAQYNGVPITSATVEYSSGKVKVSNIIGTQNGTNYSVSFHSSEYTCVVWG